MLVSILFFLKHNHSPIRNGKPLGKDLGKDFDHNYHYISSLCSKLGEGTLLFIIGNNIDVYPEVSVIPSLERDLALGRRGTFRSLKAMSVGCDGSAEH